MIQLREFFQISAFIRLSVKMKRGEFGFMVAILVTFSIIGSTDGADGNSQIETSKNSSVSLESLIEKDLNCTEGLESKSRRKRYIAFPEGSSFSVTDAQFTVEQT